MIHLGIPRQDYFLLLVDDQVQQVPEDESLKSPRNWFQIRITRQTWNGNNGESSKQTAIQLIEKVIAIIRTLNGRPDVLTIFTPTDSSASVTASRLFQLFPSFLPVVPISACAVFRPMDTCGANSLHAVVGLQYALTYCDNVFVRDMEQYMLLFSQWRSSPPTLDDLFASVGVDFVLYPLLQKQCLWDHCRVTKLIDIRSSLWHRIFAQGADIIRKDQPYDPARSLSNMIHSAHKHSSCYIDNVGLSYLQVYSAELCTYNLIQRALSADEKRCKSLPGMSKELESSEVQITPCDDSFLKVVGKQLASAAPNFKWPRLKCCELYNLHMKRDSIARVSGNSDALGALFIFDSPFAMGKLKSLQRKAESLVCTGHGAFLERLVSLDLLLVCIYLTFVLPCYIFSYGGAGCNTNMQSLQTELVLALASLEQFLVPVHK